MNEDKDKKKIRKPDPIIDGDARPDQYPNEAPDVQNREKRDENLTSNRKADVNSLEDFRDKKQ